MGNKLFMGLSALAVALIVAAVLNIAMGESHSCRGIVVDKHYKEAYTQVYTTTDAKGVPQVRTQYHPAEYDVYVRFEDTTDYLGVSSELYKEFSIDDQVIVHYIVGRFTGNKTISRLELL